jgi:hypothetical protein
MEAKFWNLYIWKVYNFFTFHPILVLFFLWYWSKFQREIIITLKQQPSWMEGGAVGHNFKRDTPRDHLCQVWLHLAKLFQRRRFFHWVTWWCLCAIVPYLFFFIYSHYRMFWYLSCCLFDIFPICVYLY